MTVKSLTLKNFRNYRESTLDFGDGINIIYGDNAQGKTNILEGIYLFSMGRSPRTNHDVEMVNYDAEKAEICLKFSDKERDLTGEMTLFKNRRKLISINDVPLKKNSELVGRFRVVYFGPEYLGLVKEGPKQRRKNLDVLISQLRPKYFSTLSSYKKLVESKNALLKMDHPNMAMLDILNTKMVDLSAEIMLYRREYIKKLEVIAKEIQKEISSGREELEIRYQTSVGEIDSLDNQGIKELIKAKLQGAKDRELNMRESLIGPHREDIGYFVNGKEAKPYASQGQQKTIVLVEKLAEVQLIKEETGDNPVLLLDDIMSELDRKRQSFILNHIKGMQIIITCTDTEGFDLNGEKKLFKIDEGQVEQEA